MRLDFSKFRGEFPKTTEYEVPHNGAKRTMNLDLRDGQLRPWRDTTVKFYVENANSFLVHGCDYLAWDECVSAVPTTVNAATILLVGRKQYAEQLRLANGAKEYARLGMPIPQQPIVSSKNETQTKDTYPTAYVVTFENKYGQESGPSPASNQVLINEETGVSVLVENLHTNLPSEYKIVAVHIYRLALPYRSGEEDNPLAEEGIYLRVGTVPFGQSSFLDTVMTIDASVPLMTDEVREAPLGLQQICAIQGSNSYVAYKGHTIHFSENNRFWNWPAAFDMTLDRNIKHIQIVNDSLLVTTTGAPYIITDLKTCEKRKCRQVDEAKMGAVGDIGCDVLYGSVATPFGMVYATADGIMMLGTDGSTKLISAPYFSSQQWGQLRPDTCKFAYWSGLLLCSTTEISFFIRLDGDTFYTESTEGLTRIDDVIRGLQTNSDGQLFLLKEDGIHHWNSSNYFREFLWENEHIGADMLQTFTAYRAHGIRTSVTIVGNDTEDEVTVSNFDDESYRLPRLGRNKNYSFIIRGTGFLTYFIIGSSIIEVSRNEGAQ